MSAKNIVLKRKIGADIFELLPKTTDENVQVTYGTAMTLGSALSEIYTDLQAWETFKADVDFAGADSALDTLRELIDMISKEDQAGSIAATLAEIRSSLSTLQTTHASDIAAIQQTITDNKTSAETAISGIDERLTAAEGTIAEHGTAIEDLGQRITDTEAASSHIYTSSTQPENLTEQDLWIEIVDGTTGEAGV